MRFQERSTIILVLIFCTGVHLMWCQNQKLADSLITLLESGAYTGNKLNLLETIVEEETDPERKLEFSKLLIKESSADSLFDYLWLGFLQKGKALELIGENDEALLAYFQSIRLAKRGELMQEVGQSQIAIADLYSQFGNSENAKTYYKRGIVLLRREDDSIALASALLNAGDEAFNTGDYETALAYFDESGLLFQDLNYPLGTAYNLGNVGMVYAEQGKDARAERNINKAVSILEGLEDYYGISIYLTYMSDIYQRKEELQKALQYAKRSLELAQLNGLNSQIRDANMKMAELHEALNDSAAAYRYFKNHIIYRDSIRNLEVVERMADDRTNFEVSQKQMEVDLLEQKRQNQRLVIFAIAGALVFIGILAFGLYRRYQFIQRTKKIIENERDRSDRLLLNILPEETAEELKEYGKVKAKQYDSITVMFSDFKGFTSYSEKLSPDALVETIGFYFSKFDDIMETYGLEKIKTIGDAYMCAGGLRENDDDHAERVVKACKDIVDFVESTKKDISASELNFDIRIGINTGPVVAGVVGTKKFAYDIWGDTVNVAARMESMSEPGEINISESTFELLKDNWNCEYRGTFEVKNRGSMKMFFVKERNYMALN